MASNRERSFLSTRLGGPRKTVDMWRAPISAPDRLRQMPTFFDRNTFFSLFPNTQETDYWLYLEWHRTQAHFSERIGTDASVSVVLAEAVGAEDMEAAASDWHHGQAVQLWILREPRGQHIRPRWVGRLETQGGGVLQRRRRSAVAESARGRVVVRSQQLFGSVRAERRARADGRMGRQEGVE